MCNHDKKPGQTQCNVCQAAYMREYRRTTRPREVRQAHRAGWESALHAVRVALLEAGDTPLDGFSAAELVRRIGLD